MTAFKINLAWIGLAMSLASSPAVLAQDASPTLQRIKQTSTLTIGHREASQPFAYLDEQRRVRGYTIDLCDKIAASIKKELGIPELKIEYTPVNPQTRIPLIANGTVDLECGSTTINISRQQQVDFSIPFFLTGARMAVRRNAGIREIEDMAGKSIGFAQGTTDERAVRAIIESRGIKNIRIVNFRDHAEGMLALETDRIDAYVSDDVLLSGLIARSRLRDQLQVVGRALTFSPYGIMMRRNDSAFRLVVNRTLATIYRSGEISALFEKWFAVSGIEMSPELRMTFDLNSWDD